jgi:uncharacterized protein (TIGR03435 family)
MKTVRGTTAMSQRQQFYAAFTAAMLMLTITPQLCASQTSGEAQTLAYDVVSIKAGQDSRHVMMRFLPDGYAASGITLRFLIENAYYVRRDQILGGPGWIDSALFDLEAKVDPSDAAAYGKLSVKERGLLLKPVLEDRFQLKAHRETRESTLYHLVPAKSGPKLKASVAPMAGDGGEPAGAPDAGPRPGGPPRGEMIWLQLGKLIGNAVTTGKLAGMLSDQLHSMVIDKTGLTGNYDIQLTFAPEDGSGWQNSDAGDAASLFTAIQEQLGLRLEPTRGMVDVLVVDRAEMPSKN